MLARGKAHRCAAGHLYSSTTDHILVPGHIYSSTRTHIYPLITRRELHAGAGAEVRSRTHILPIF